MHAHEELIGADYTEHNIHHPGVGVTRAVSVLKNHVDNVDLGLIPVGKNQGIIDSYMLYQLMSNCTYCNRSHGLFGTEVCQAVEVKAGGYSSSIGDEGLEY